MGEHPRPASDPAAAEVVAEAPASAANLGPGFDALGVALELRLQVRMALRPRRPEQAGEAAPWPPTLGQLRVGGEAAGQVEEGPENLVWKAAEAVFARMGPRPGPETSGQAGPGESDGWIVDVWTAGAIPLASGLGSSAAAVVAAMWAANALFGAPLAYEQLLDLAAAFEGHPDNVAPAYLGGWVAAGVRDGRVVAVRIPAPRGEVVAVVAVPAMKLPTAEARKVLGSSVSLGDAVFNLQGAALVAACVTTGRWSWLRAAMEDRLHQPARLPLVPGAAGAIRRAVVAGAYGACLSGAGPSVLALAPPWRADEVAAAMEGAFAEAGLACRRLVLAVADQGVRVRTRAAAAQDVEGD